MILLELQKMRQLAPANKTAILCRAIKPVTAIIIAALKNDRLLEWDQTLVINAVQSVLGHQIEALRAREKTKLANKLDENRKDLVYTLDKDQLLTIPKTMHATFNALFTKDHLFTSRLNSDNQQRGQKFISRMTGHCIGYND